MEDKFEVQGLTPAQQKEIVEHGWQLERLGDNYFNVIAPLHQSDDCTDWLDSQNIEWRMV